jgi:hypothetical protein
MWRNLNFREDLLCLNASFELMSVAGGSLDRLGYGKFARMYPQEQNHNEEHHHSIEDVEKILMSK